MIGRIVVVADDRRHLFMSRGSFVVQDTEGERNELDQVPRTEKVFDQFSRLGYALWPEHSINLASHKHEFSRWGYAL